MNRKAALKALMEGKQITRDHWSSDMYIYMDTEGRILNGYDNSLTYDLNVRPNSGWVVKEEKFEITESELRRVLGKYCRDQWLETEIISQLKSGGYK
jgi:hypothetical protein